MAIGSDPIEDGEATPAPAEQAEVVHDARKAIKRMRALARLLRDELGEREFRDVNGALRDTARHLASARDAEVRLATLDALCERHPKALAPELVRPLRTRLEGERGAALAPSEREQVLADLATMRDRLAHWELLEQDFDAIAPGLRRLYREGRRRLRRAKRGRAHRAQDMHDWRKRVKSLYYVLEMLGGKDHKSARGPTRRADRLGDLLGEEHDLWMLGAYLQRHADVFEEHDSTRKALLKRIHRRRKRLRKRALRSGARLYGRKPGSFTRRIDHSLSV